MKKKSIIGQKFGNLEVIEYLGIKNSGSCWLCECNCGNRIRVHRSVLMNGKKDCGCSRNLIGKKFGKLAHTYWMCKCDCGNIVIKRRNHLKIGYPSCGCVNRGKNNWNWLGYEGISGSLFYDIKRSAKKRDLDFDIDMAYIWELFQKQQGRCALTSEEITLPSVRSSMDSNPSTASLDRIDSSGGYVKGNVQWVHRDINFMKHTLSKKRFVELCKKVAEFDKSGGLS
jgi:hypothetical protein